MALDPTTEQALINLAIAEAPSVIAALKGLFSRGNPGVPAPTDAEVIAAFDTAFRTSLAVDEQWLTNHPEGVA